MKKNREQKASILYLLSTIINKGIAFLTIPIYTRLLTTSDYGIVNTYTSWVDIFTVIFSLALYMSIRTAFVDFRKEKKEFLNTIITFTILISMIAGVVLIVTGTLFLKSKIILIICVVLQGTASALIMDYQQYLMMDFKYVQRSCFLAIPNFLSAILSIYTLLFMPIEHKYIARIVPMVITYMIFGIIIIIKIYNKERPSIKLKYLRYGLSISLPLVLHGIALNILSQSDRTMISILDNVSSTGIYSIIYNFGMIATAITTALEGVWIPYFMTKMKANDINTINQKANEYIKLITYIMIALILVGPEVLKILASQQYWDGIKIIPPIILANYFIYIYSLYINVEHFYKKTKIITINTFVAAIVNIILNFILIPKYGYFAAAYTTMASYLIALILHATYTYKLEKNIFPIKDMIIPFCKLTVITIIYYIFINNTIVRWIICTVMLIAAILNNWTKIRKYLRNGDK